MSAADTNSAKRIALLPGDGVGKEVIAEAARALRAVAAAGGRKLEMAELDWGADRYLRDGTTLPEGGDAMLREKFEAVLLGALGDPRVPSNKHAADILLGLRFKLDLYINARPIQLLDASLTPLRDRQPRDVNFMVFRENTEGLYVGIGGIFKKGTPDEVALQEDVNTRKGVERIIRHAFEYARRNKLTRLCMSDKSNALNFAHDLWQRVFAEVRMEYADVEARHLFIDTLAMEVVRDPSQFQVIVTCNLFGDIISDLGAQLAGGMGMTPSGNIHPGQVSIFEPVHGSAPNIAGKNQANPIASVLAAAMMLDHIGWPAEAATLRAAVRASVAARQTTRDIGGPLGTCEAGEWLVNWVTKQGIVRNS